MTKKAKNNKQHPQDMRATKPNMHQRPAAFAGSFYPDNSQQLDYIVSHYLANSSTGLTLAAHNKVKPRIIIAPHAGYRYSGEVAASAYACLSLPDLNIKRVVVLALSHKHRFTGLCLPESTLTHFLLPNNAIPVDQANITQLLKQPFITAKACLRDNAYHADEYAIEVQLPFLTQQLKTFDLVPILFGEAEPSLIKAVMAFYLNSPDTLIVISSDLSHYLSNSTAVKVDQYTAQCIETLNCHALTAFHACGYSLIQAASELALKHQLNAVTLDVRNAYQTTHQQSEYVVGYGAFAYFANK